MRRKAKLFERCAVQCERRWCRSHPSPIPTAQAAVQHGMAYYHATCLALAYAAYNTALLQRMGGRPFGLGRTSANSKQTRYSLALATQRHKLRRMLARSKISPSAIVPVSSACARPTPLAAHLGCAVSECQSQTSDRPYRRAAHVVGPQCVRVTRLGSLAGGTVNGLTESVCTQVAVTSRLIQTLSALSSVSEAGLESFVHR